MQANSILRKLASNIKYIYSNVIAIIINFIIIQGKKCDKCNTIAHIHCLKDYTMNHSLGCPNCHFISESDNSNNCGIFYFIIHI